MQINLRSAQKLIEKACSKKLSKPDLKLYQECTKMWNSRPDMFQSFNKIISIHLGQRKH